ncbi:MAG: polysaccharide deacetylase family protein [Bacteroidota bacterium]
MILLPLFVSVMVFFSGKTYLKSQDTKEANINCFVYHRFGEEDLPSTNISVSKFKQQLEFLHENDYTVLTFGEAVEKLNSADDLPEKTAVLTVDDGYKSFKTAAVPLLDQYGYKATIFICTQYVGKSGYLSWNDIQSLREEGYEFGNHSHSHDHFLNYSDAKTREQFIEDLDKSEEIFRRELGDKPDLYCYPYGEYNPDMQEILKERGYQAAAAQKSGVLYSDTDLYAIPRFPMTSTYGEIDKFKSKAGMNALPVIKEMPVDPEIKDTNPPRLTLHIQPGKINPDNIQCFVNGRRTCKISRKDDSPLILDIRASEALRTRRTLYTITAPSKSGDQWYWYTHLWVNTQYGE